MRAILILIAFCSVAAAAGPFSAAAVPAAPAAAGAAEPRVYESPGRFRAEIPGGFAPSAAPLAPPIVAVFGRPAAGGEELLIVERYDDGEARGAFVHNLSPEGPPAPTRRAVGGRVYDLYEGIRLESFTERIPDRDPYADVLGSEPPPRLNYLDARRFPPGGEAYKDYRCRKRGAWALLHDYRQARGAGAAALEEFRKAYLDDSARRLVAVCFGPAAAGAMDRGEEIARIPKPSMFRLRMRAREEFRYGAVRKVERESLLIFDAPRAFYVLRYRAPGGAYRKEDPAFLAFIAGFKVLEKER